MHLASREAPEQKGVDRAERQPACLGALARLRAGAVLMDIDSGFRVDSRSLGRGTNIDAEDDLGLDDTNTVFRGELAWRLARRHQLRAGYFDLSGGQ